jgi:hypothetical protein
MRMIHSDTPRSKNCIMKHIENLDLMVLRLGKIERAKRTIPVGVWFRDSKK